jgi:hypothetical protein
MWCPPSYRPPSTPPSPATMPSPGPTAITVAPVPSLSPLSPTCNTMVLGVLSTSIVGPRPDTYFGPEASASKFKLLHPDFIGYLTERYGDWDGMGLRGVGGWGSWEDQQPFLSLCTPIPHPAPFTVTTSLVQSARHLT